MFTRESLNINLHVCHCEQGCGVTVYIKIYKVYVEERFTSSKSGLDLASEHLISIVFPWFKHHGKECRIRCFLEIPIRVQEFTHLKGMQQIVLQVGNSGKSSLHEGVNLKVKFELSS